MSSVPQAPAYPVVHHGLAVRAAAVRCARKSEVDEGGVIEAAMAEYRNSRNPLRAHRAAQEATLAAVTRQIGQAADAIRSILPPRDPRSAG